VGSVNFVSFCKSDVSAIQDHPIMGVMAAVTQFDNRIKIL